MADLILGGSKITADGDYSLLLGRKVKTNLDSILKSFRIPSSLSNYSAFLGGMVAFQSDINVQILIILFDASTFFDYKSNIYSLKTYSSYNPCFPRFHQA